MAKIAGFTPAMWISGHKTAKEAVSTADAGPFIVVGVMDVLDDATRDYGPFMLINKQRLQEMAELLDKDESEPC
jgi:hypothetical protein